MDSSRRELNALIAEADRVVADCGRYLEAAEELVEGVPRRRAVVEERLAAAEEMLEQADKELKRVRKDDDAGWVDDASWADEREAQWARDQASRKVFRIQWYELSSDDFDLENRKAVARQVAGLLREEAEQRLDAIAGRDENPELRGAVAERKDEVLRTTRYLTRKYAEARSLQHDEVMTARAEAHNILDRLKTRRRGRERPPPERDPLPPRPPTPKDRRRRRRGRTARGDHGQPDGTLEAAGADRPCLGRRGRARVSKLRPAMTLVLQQFEPVDVENR